MEGTVILESRIKRGGKRIMWVVTEVAYRDAEGGVYLSKPLVLSVDGDNKDRLESVMWAIMDAKESYFNQVMMAVETQKAKGGAA